MNTIISTCFPYKKIQKNFILKRINLLFIYKTGIFAVLNKFDVFSYYKNE